MGYDLYSVNEGDREESYFRWNIWGWPSILTLASIYGWKPEGTTIPLITSADAEEHNIGPEEFSAHNQNVVDWDGSYSSNDGQLVSDSDAGAMAQALEDSLDDIPDFEIKVPGSSDDGTTKILDNPLHDRHRQALRRGSRAAFAVEYSGTENKDYIREFITFLRRGGYNIH